MLSLRLPSLCFRLPRRILSRLGRAGRLGAGTLLVAALLAGTLLLGAGTARAQSPVTTLEDAEGEEVMQIFENGDLTLFQNGALTVPGVIETTDGGLVLPDGTTLEGASDLGQLSLPFSGSEESEGPLFELENTGSGPAIQASAGDIVASSGAFVLSDGTRLQGSGDLGGGGVPTTESGAFDLSNDEGVAAAGTFDSGSIPTEGAGTRMMWYPAKAALRAGRVFDDGGVDGSQFWNAPNVGTYSVAFGRNTKASGEGATALSWETSASGKYATAIGLQTSAEGPATLAIGDETTASGGAATAMGNRTTASGPNATAMGSRTTAATERSLSLGECNSANTSADGTLFVVGSGSSSAGSCDSRQDALMLQQDGGLAASGTFETGSIPVEGAGTRMMWYPEKAAFRAGRVFDGAVDGSQFWDDQNVGTYSVAFGRNTKADGNQAMAIGSFTTASGGGALAMGFSTTASGAGATAMGAFTTASGNHAMAVGNNTMASGSDATAMGSSTTASGSNATAMGEETTASGNYSMAAGDQTTASGLGTAALGVKTTASGGSAVAMGSSTTASGLVSTAFGILTTASGDYAAAMGEETIAATENSLSIGSCNDANREADGTLFVVGNSDGTCNSGSDALVLDEQGNLEISGTLTESSDRRLKTSIEPLGPGVLQKLASLRPVRYQFKDQRTHPSGKQIGLIAQEVRKEFPSLVRESSDGMLSLAYSKLTAVLVKGIQEQQSTIDRQGQRISKLEAESKTQDQKIDQLEKRLAALEAQPGGPLPAGVPGPGLLIGLLLGGGLGAALFWRRK